MAVVGAAHLAITGQPQALAVAARRDVLCVAPGAGVKMVGVELVHQEHTECILVLEPRLRLRIGQRGVLLPLQRGDVLPLAFLGVVTTEVAFDGGPGPVPDVGVPVVNGQHSVAGDADSGVDPWLEVNPEGFEIVSVNPLSIGRTDVLADTTVGIPVTGAPFFPGFTLNGQITFRWNLDAAVAVVAFDTEGLTGDSLRITGDRKYHGTVLVLVNRLRLRGGYPVI